MATRAHLPASQMPHPNRQHNARSARPAADAGGAHHVLGLRPTMDSDDEQLLQTSVREIQRSIVPRRERGAQAKRGPSAAPHRVAPKKTLDPNLKRRVESARVGPGGVAPVGRSAKGGQEHKGGKGARGGGVLMQALEEQMGEGGEGRRHGNGNARGEKARESFGAWDDGVGGEGKKAAGLEDWGVDLRTP